MISAFRGKRFLSARYGPPPAHKPRAGRQRRYPTPSPAAPLLSLPTRSLPRSRHVPVFSRLSPKTLPHFRKLRARRSGERANEQASSPSPRPRRPTGTLLPLPFGGARPPSRLPAQPQAASSSAAVSPQEDWGLGGTLESAAPPPPRFFFLSRLWDLAAGEVLSRAALSEETRAQASAAAREPSWAQDIPSFASGPLHLGWDVTKESARRLSPTPVSSRRERTRDPRLESLCLRSGGTAPSSQASERAR